MLPDAGANIIIAHGHDADHQLLFAFKMRREPTEIDQLARQELYSGKRCRWDRTDILGIADREKLPDWAKEKAEEYEQHRTAQKKERGEER